MRGAGRHRLGRRALLATYVPAAVLLAIGCGQEPPPATPTVPTAATPADSTPVAPVVPTATVAPEATIAPEPTAAPTVPSKPAERSPLGGRLLYTRRGNLFVLEGGRSRQLTSTGDLVWPRWSPDGRQIAVVRRGDSFSELHLLDPQGQNLIQLTRHQSRQTLGSKEYVFSSIWATWPTWDPTGTKVLYAADVNASHMALWQVEVKGGRPTPLSATADLGANIESPVYAPDGKSLVFCLSFDTPTQLWLLTMVTGTRMPITDGKQTVYDPAWSPDGKALAASIIDGLNSSIWLLSADGKQRTPLIRKPAGRAATWSPDGAHLTFIAEEGGRFNLYVADLTTDGAGSYAVSEMRRLTNDGDIDAPSGLSWAK